MQNIDNDPERYEQIIRQLEQEVDYLNRQYTITNAQRLNFQQKVPNFQISPYHIKLYQQIKSINCQLRKSLELQQTGLAEERRGFELQRIIDTENDLLIQRLRQHIYEHQMKIIEYKTLLQSQKQSVFNLKNRPFLKKQLMTENYGQLKMANDILTEQILEKVRKNRELEMQLGQLKKRYDLVQLPRIIRDVRNNPNS